MKKKNKKLAVGVGVTLLILLVGGMLFFGIRQATYGGTTNLAISNIELVDGGARIRVLAVAGTGAEELSIDWSASQINQKLSGTGLEATKGVTGRIQLQDSTRIFKTIRNDNQQFKNYEVTDEGTFTICSLQNCNPSPGYEAVVSTRTALASCYCINGKTIGINSDFSGQVIDDSTVSINIGGATGELKPAQGQTSITLNDGRTKAEWTGNLLNYQTINQPGYKVLYLNGLNTKLIDSNAYSLFQEKINTDFGTFFECRTGSLSNARTCISNLNTEINNLLVSKTAAYQNAVGAESVEFKSDSVNVGLRTASNFYTVIITLDASKVGIKELVGKPEIVSCVPNKNTISGNTYTNSIAVKNIGENDGSFSGSVTCSGFTGTGYISEVLVKQGQTANLPITLTGTNTGEDDISGSCTWKITDRKSGASDSCTSQHVITPGQGLVCEANSERCLSADTLRKCSSDGRSYQDIICEQGSCVQDQSGEGSCAGNELVCSWYQEYSPGDTGCGILNPGRYLGTCNPEPHCKTSMWVWWVGGAVIVLLLLLFLIPPKQNSGVQPIIIQR